MLTCSRQISYRGWSLLFYDQKVQIKKENLVKGKGWPKYLIITGERRISRSPFPVLSIYQTGALTITIDPEGDMRMKSFLKENLPLRIFD